MRVRVDDNAQDIIRVRVVDNAHLVYGSLMPLIGLQVL